VERALDLGLLTAALAGRTGIPSAQQLQELIADVEVQLLLRRAQIPQELLDAAWYLHGVASVDQARGRYTLARQRQAFLVSAHIFDLALNQDDWSRIDKLSFGFAAAIGYRRGGRDPNATAIMNRLRADIDVESPVLDHMDSLPLETGLAFLGFETKTLFTWLATWRRQLTALARASQLEDLRTTAFGTTHLAVLGAGDLLAYFARGDSAGLERGRARLRAAATGQAGPADLNARWVAAHLLALSGEAEAGSLWNPTVLPPTVPALVRQAFTIGSPPVLTLWEPQRDLLTGDQSPFDPRVKRMVLAVPTSGGKTLLAQLMAVEHLARTERSVCYVASTRSLCREVRRAMTTRVRLLDKETGPDLPDFPTTAELLDVLDRAQPADVEVMTPERLAHLLRHDAPAVLERFGLFIFDEAQLLKESGRGFVLESTIALLDYLTRQTDHQIVLISAAMGNAGAIAQWLSPDGQALLHESQWRGPRRLHAAFTTEARWNETRRETIPRGRVWPYRLVTPLSGEVRLRMANGRTSRLSTQGDTGWRLVRKSKTTVLLQFGLPPDDERSTKRYVIASQMIVELGHAGSVLLVAGTRDLAKLLAQGLADELDEHPGSAPLVDFVRVQLGDDHPLVDVLRHGVGFHHAGLPIEVLEALEQAVRDDTLPYLTCTSTLTDGVNLPVRTVVIYDQTYEGQSDDARLRGARLVNAMGRAGRAGKETEGWIVLVRAAPPTEADFRDLNPDADALAVTSSLTTPEALHAFAALEQSLRDDEDALFRATDPGATDFISFVWLVLAIEEEGGTEPGSVDIANIVDSTLAAVQSSQARTSCLAVAYGVRNAYMRTDADARRRWPRSGTSISSARIIDQLARGLADRAIDLEQAGKLIDIGDPLNAMRMPNAIAQLLDLPEAPAWRFRISPHGDDIEVKPVDLLTGWLAGTSLSDLAQSHLAAATTSAWRIEQMVDAVTRHFEHYLAWTVGALVELVNTRLADAGTEERLCPDLGSYIRYGVDDPKALILMSSGIRSRRLAHAIVADLPADLEPTRETLRLWIAIMGVPEWRTRYNASASEVLDLLDFTRVRSRSLLKTLLEAGSAVVELPVMTSSLPAWDGPLTLESLRGEPQPSPLAVYAGDQHIITVAAQDHADLSAILDTGLAVSVEIATQTERPTLSITLSFADITD
jgi:DEAD/DEAH box helicase